MRRSRGHSKQPLKRACVVAWNVVLHSGAPVDNALFRKVAPIGLICSNLLWFPSKCDISSHPKDKVDFPLFCWISIRNIRRITKIQWNQIEITMKNISNSWAIRHLHSPLISRVDARLSSFLTSPINLYHRILFHLVLCPRLTLMHYVKLKMLKRVRSTIQLPGLTPGCSWFIFMQWRQSHAMLTW
jgi:hypothetical protein